MNDKIIGTSEESGTAQEEHFKNPKQLAEAIKKLIDKGAQNVSLTIGDLVIPVKPKDKIALKLLFQLLEHPEIKTVGDVIEVLQDAIIWHQLIYIIKHSDEQNAKKQEEKPDLKVKLTIRLNKKEG